jgi:hypothetical protein
MMKAETMKTEIQSRDDSAFIFTLFKDKPCLM